MMLRAVHLEDATLLQAQLWHACEAVRASSKWQRHAWHRWDLGRRSLPIFKRLALSCRLVVNGLNMHCLQLNETRSASSSCSGHEDASVT